MQPSNQNLKVVAINSFAVHGTASLKAITTILGSRVLPVPSVILDGLTNLPGVKKFPSPLKDLLKGVFELVKYRKQEVILYTGYLGQADQINVILDIIAEYRQYIRFIICDPICGDHGKAYVPQDIIELWPNLLRTSDLIFPNITEVKLLLGLRGDEEGEDDVYIKELIEKFPGVNLCVTSIKRGNDEIGIQLFQKTSSYSYYHSLLGKNIGGSGDTFAALFILNHFYRQLSEKDALAKSAETTYQLIQKSIDAGADELIIEGDAGLEETAIIATQTVLTK
jgi:pyridoxine kinase